MLPDNVASSAVITQEVEDDETSKNESEDADDGDLKNLKMNQKKKKVQMT